MKKESLDKSIRKNKYNLALFLLIIVDFLFTYLGINYYDSIEEGNPLLVWLFDLPFLSAFSFRLLHACTLLILCWYIQKQEYKYYNFFICFVLTVNILIILLHFSWLLPVLIQF